MKKLQILIFASLFGILLYSCNEKKTSQEEKMLQTGLWKATLDIQGQELPFIFEVSQPDSNRYHITLINGEERLVINEIKIVGDSIFIPMHIFDATITGKIENNSITGFWTKNYVADYKIPFRAVYNIKDRFEASEVPPGADINGTWAVKFTHEGETEDAVGVFEQKGKLVTGTFLTPTGDYRYLEGIMQGNQLMMSAFDGEHAFLFKASLNDKQMLEGNFWSGKTWHATWAAVKDSSASLPDPNQLTFLKEGYDKVELRFPNLKGEMISLDHEKYQGKVLILQVFGTWCPNCMDETRFLANWYRKNEDRGVEIIGLAYEKKDDFTYAKTRIEKTIARWDVAYDFLVAGTQDNAAETLPMLNHVMSFPTTIFIDRTGKVRRIHTGFSGPGTGKYYEAFVQDFNLFMDKLLEENPS